MQHLTQPGALSSFTIGKTRAASSTDSPVADDITVTQMSSLDAGLQKLSGTVDYLENQSRRSNLRIDEIAEIPGETWAQKEAVRAKLAK